MKVRAIKKGFHVTTREPDDEFDLDGPVPHWCEKVSDKEEADKPQAKPKAKPADKPQAKPEESGILPDA